MRIVQRDALEEEEGDPFGIADDGDDHARGLVGCAESEAERVVVVVHEFVAPRKMARAM
jgi:hypothetical protein